MFSHMLYGGWPKVKKAYTVRDGSPRDQLGDQEVSPVPAGENNCAGDGSSWVCSLQAMKDPKGKLGQSLLELLEHRFTVIHRSEILHIDTDALSNVHFRRVWVKQNTFA